MNCVFHKILYNPVFLGDPSIEYWRDASWMPLFKIGDWMRSELYARITYSSQFSFVMMLQGISFLRYHEILGIIRHSHPASAHFVSSSSQHKHSCALSQFSSHTNFHVPSYHLKLFFNPFWFFPSIARLNFFSLLLFSHGPSTSSSFLDQVSSTRL
jgi:hypothetical protein